MCREAFESLNTMLRPAQDQLDLASIPSDNTTDSAIGDVTGRCCLWDSGGCPAPCLPGHDVLAAPQMEIAVFEHHSCTGYRTGAAHQTTVNTRTQTNA
jgi:hypothetical protein